MRLALISKLKARLCFRGINKKEGDLKGVEVSLFKDGSIVNNRKIADFENACTIDKSGKNSDDLIFNRQDIGVEGYQTSNMSRKRYNDLHYGILVRNIPDDCDHLSVKVFDVSGPILLFPNHLPLSTS